MAKYALIKNSKVENIIEASDSFISNIADKWDDIIDVSDIEVKRGNSYDGSSFTDDPVEENVEEILSNLKAEKIDEIRKQRNAMLRKTDEKWIEAFSKKEYRTPIENDKEILRDLMATVEQEVNSMTEKSQVDEYDPISSLELSNDYGDE